MLLHTGIFSKAAGMYYPPVVTTLIAILLQILLRRVKVQLAKHSKPGTEIFLHVSLQSTAYLKLPTPYDRILFCPFWLVIVINGATHPKQEEQQDIWKRGPWRLTSGARTAVPSSWLSFFITKCATRKIPQCMETVLRHW